MISLTLRQAHEGLKAKKFSAVELARAYLDRIALLNPKLNAYVLVTQEEALAQAERIDEKGDFSSPLAGIPMNLKDVFCTEGIRTTACSRMLADFVPPYSAHAYERLREAGAVLLGKTNTDEFAMGSSSENSVFGPTRNPWNTDHVAGGSSGGPAASVAADLAVFSLGTDTGGSIRQPASLCSAVGLKVTYGRVPRQGVIAYASSLDTIGPFAKTVEDAALVLQAMAGRSEKDATTPDAPVPDYSAFLKTDLKGKILGLPKQYFGEGVQKETADAILAAVEALKGLGAQVREVDLPLTKYAIPAYYILAKSEASSNLSRYDGLRFGHAASDAKDLEELYMKSRQEGFGDEVKRAIMLGTYCLSSGYYEAYYLKAARVRALLKREFDEAFALCDALISPVSPFPAFRVGEKFTDPMAMYMADSLTVAVNLAGICALSVPAGFTAKGFPIGMQIMANQFGEGELFHVGHAFERATEWHKRKPNLD